MPRSSAASARKRRTAQRPVRRRSWVRWLLASPIVSVALLCVFVGALTCRPSWFHTVAVDYARLEADKRSMTDHVDRISAALNRRESIEVTLDEAQVNRWIAARDEWPGFAQRVNIEPLQHPQINCLHGNRIRVAALFEQMGFGVVASGVIELELSDDHLVIRWDAAGLGALPIPRGLIERAARRLTEKDKSARDLLSGGELRLPNDWVWPNGKRRYRIREIRIDDGEAHLTLEPR